jgi:glutamyl-tRNA reductase
VSVLVVGLSHKSAPVAILEQAAVSGDTLTKLLHDIALADSVAETFVVSTCNRVEVYADVDRFHAGVTDICELLARHCGVSGRDLTPYLYVHYDERAVSHLLAVACGLDSLVVGEEQIVGQVRSGIRMAAEQGAVGRVLGDLGRLALRAAKRARTETGIGRTGVSLLSLAIEAAAPSLPAPALAGTAPGVPSLAGRDVLVVGAGSMSALVVATACRDGGKPRAGQPDAPTRREVGCQVERHPDPGHWTCWPAHRHGGGGCRDLLYRRGRSCDHGRRGARQAARGPRVP